MRSVETLVISRLDRMACFTDKNEWKAVVNAKDGETGATAQATNHLVTLGVVNQFVNVQSHPAFFS